MSIDGAALQRTHVRSTACPRVCTSRADAERDKPVTTEMSSFAAGVFVVCRRCRRCRTTLRDDDDRAETCGHAGCSRQATHQNQRSRRAKSESHAPARCGDAIVVNGKWAAPHIRIVWCTRMCSRQFCHGHAMV